MILQRCFSHVPLRSALPFSALTLVALRDLAEVVPFPILQINCLLPKFAFSTLNRQKIIYDQTLLTSMKIGPNYKLGKLIFFFCFCFQQNSLSTAPSMNMCSLCFQFLVSLSTRPFSSHALTSIRMLRLNNYLSKIVAVNIYSRYTNLVEPDKI